MNRRVLGILGLAAGVAAAVWVLSADPTAPPPPALPPADGNGGHEVATARAPFQQSQECRACHEAVYAEWEASYHGMAWTDPMVQALSGGFTQTECIDCHAPMPIHVTGVDQRVAPRAHARSDGVDCLTCHILPDGVSVAAGRSVDTSATPGACRPVEVPVMSDSTACIACHNQHETVDEVIASGTGKNCLDCHMEPADRDGRPGRSHVFPGAHDVAMHRRAVTLNLEVADGAIRATVTNVGGAHHVPTDARHRSYNLWITLVDDRGNVVQDERQMVDGEMRLYYRQDFRPSTQIAHGKSHVGTWPLPEGISGRAVVRLVYALNPEELGAKKVTEVHQAEIRFP